LVLVSLSTYAYARMRETLQSVVDATAGLGVPVVATTGPAIDPAQIRGHADLEVLRFVPHAHVMPRATVFVGHGGHGGTMTALAHDLPVLLLPMYDLADQPMVARSIERAGAGRTLSRRSAPAEIRAALHGLLADGAHRVSAARLGAAIRRRDASRTAADILESTFTNRAAQH
jgi:UDP:flavonoid glycosyltransferase YjiC (YdhE family)